MVDCCNLSEFAHADSYNILIMCCWSREDVAPTSCWRRTAAPVLLEKNSSSRRGRGKTKREGTRGEHSRRLVTFGFLVARGIEILISAKTPQRRVHANSAGEVTPPPLPPGVRCRAGGGGRWVAGCCRRCCCCRGWGRRCADVLCCWRTSTAVLRSCIFNLSVLQEREFYCGYTCPLNRRLSDRRTDTSDEITYLHLVQLTYTWCRSILFPTYLHLVQLTYIWCRNNFGSNSCAALQLVQWRWGFTTGSNSFDRG